MTLIGPHSRPGKLAIIDGRRAEARRMKEIREGLIAHLGGTPSIAENMLIQRIAMLMLRMELMDARALKNGDMSERDGRQYLAWNGAVARMLRQLGLKATPARPLTLAERLAQLGPAPTAAPPSPASDLRAASMVAA